MIYFYARVSTKEQNLDRQLESVNEYKEPDRVFCDKQTGTNFNRAEYQEMKSLLEAGDEVIIKELDRLGRNKDGIKDEIKWFKEKGVTLRVLDLPTTLIDFQGQDWIGDMINNILVEVLGSIAEQEVAKTHKRQREGIDAMPVIDGKRVSRKTGRAYGRPEKEIGLHILQGYQEKVEKKEMTVVECCEALGISRSKWYKVCRS